MASIKQERATANLRMLEFVARKLGPLNEEVIYLAACICTGYPEINFLVLCGHTHDKAQYSPFPNLIVETGQAEYNAPEIQKIIWTE